MWGSQGFSDQEQAVVARKSSSAGCVGRALNPSTREAEAGASLPLPAQLDLHSETCLKQWISGRLLQTVWGRQVCSSWVEERLFQPRVRT